VRADVDCREEGVRIHNDFLGVEFGEVASLAGRTATVIGHTGEAGARRAALVLTAADKLSFVDLGPLAAFTPLPRIVAGANLLLVAAFEPDGKRVSVSSLVWEAALSPGPRERWFDVAMPASVGSFDVRLVEGAAGAASALVAFDDTEGTHSGVEVWSGSKGAMPKRVASVHAALPDGVRLSPRPWGTVLFFSDGAEEMSDAGDPNEGPGQERSRRWLVAQALNLQGEPLGPPRTWTDQKGRVGAFVPQDLGVYLLDEVESAPGRGGRIRYMRSTPNDAAPEKGEQTLVEGVSVGTGLEVLRGGANVYLSYLDVDGAGRLWSERQKPLSMPRDARPVALLEGTSDGTQNVLALSLDEGARLRKTPSALRSSVLRCVPPPPARAPVEDEAGAP
jgi:hypothetical protein